MPGLRTRRLMLAALAAVALVALLAAPTALGDAITPESGGSPNADDIDTLYGISLYIGLVIFLIVEGTLIWSLVRYRARRGGPEAAQLRGNTPLELGWTAGAAAIVALLTVVTFLYLDDIENPQLEGAGEADATQVAQRTPPAGDGRPLNIKVNGQQYLWRYDYPGREQLFSYHEMVVPTNTTVTLEITSSDVIHSWWAPKLGGKSDAVPGHVAETWFRIEDEGLYKAVCAELCGANHADMRAQVRAVSPEEFEAWAERTRAAIKAAQEALAAQRERREGTAQVR